MNVNRFLVAAVIALLCVTTAWSMPARPGKRVLADPDGRIYEVTLIGDEFFHQYVDDDGNAFIRDAEGYFHPVDDEESARRRNAGARIPRPPPHNTPGMKAAGEEKKNPGTGGD
ncbi:MAG: hypothetical protein K2M31_10480, partial [Muribaculaceae bacterium]|nr:hypothetical protein [Muribaculaceae bacterium]